MVHASLSRPRTGEPLGQPRRRWLRVSLAVLIVAIGAAGVVAATLKSADRDDPYTRTDAVTAFRVAAGAPAPQGVSGPTDAPAPTAVTGPQATRTQSSGPSKAAPHTPPSQGGPAAAGLAAVADRRPADGVYLYETAGGEQLDVLGRATHDYPHETSMTVTHTPCGFDTRWQPLENRWDLRSFCVQPSGLRLVGLSTYREFYGRGKVLATTCTPDSFYVFDADAWSATCQSEQTTITLNGRRGPTTLVTIAGTTVPAQIIELSISTVDPDGRGSTTATATLHAQTQLLLELNSKTRSELSAGAKYQEDYHLRLESLQPQR
jgi:hypothetical protein